MSRWIISFILILMIAATGCSPVRESPPIANLSLVSPSPSITTAPASVTPLTPQTVKPTPGISLPNNVPSNQRKLPLRYHNTTRDGIRIYLVSFDDRDYTLTVADQPGGTGSRWTTAQQAAASRNGIASINGGFFTPDGKPLGILIDSGSQRGGWNKSSLGAGIYLSSNSRSAIIRRETYQKTRDSWQPSDLLQTGPMLVESGSPISGLSKNNQRPRSFIAWDGKHHWAIGYTEPCTLANLSNALANRTPGGFEIKTAVNLDGGRSSDLWASSKVPGGGKTHRGFFNKPVRNYLVLKAR